MKFKKNIISNIILHVLSMGIGFITSILIARGLGSENQGQLSFYLLIFGIIASYGHIGITSATNYFIKKSNFSKEQVINNNISSLLILSAIYIASVVIFKDSIFTNNIYSLVFIWSIYAISLLFNNFFVTIYVSDENIYVYNRFFNFAYILKGAVIVILYCTNCINIINISILYATLEIIKLILLVLGLKIKYQFYIDIKILRQEFKYGIPLYLAALFIYLNYRADQLMVRQFLGNAELGIYSISVQLAELAFIFPESITSAFEGRLYSCKEEERKSVSAQVIKLAFYLTLCICIIGIICKPLVTVLYGEDYARAGNCMIILLIGIIFASIGKVSPAYFYTKGESKIHLMVSGIVLAINLMMNAILIPNMGINGAAIASTMSYFFYGGIYIFMLRKEKITIRQLFALHREDWKRIKEMAMKIILRKQGEQNG